MSKLLSLDFFLPRISILQLAITDRVYILDLFQLYMMKGAEATLQEFFQRFFTSSNVVKIGKRF